jgi:transitional endoplasmic reticulum ATPase
MSSAIEDLLEACEARPQSAALQTALLDAVKGPAPASVAELFCGLDPTGFETLHRRRVADFLSEAGLDDAARRWAPAAPQPVAIAEAANVVSLFGDQKAPSGPLATERTEVTFADIGGLDAVKQQIRRKIITPFEKPGLFQAFRKRAGGGVLMYGPPGCGKTMLARATAGEVSARFFSVAITDVLNKWIGESERRLAAIFEQARAATPAVLFFDEIEALTSRNRGNADPGAALVSAFLNEMDGFSKRSEGLLILAATNTPWAVDAAFRRPGRFDRTLFVPPPDAASRRAIVESLLEGRPLAPGLDAGFIVESTSGFSGADLSGLIEIAVELAIDESSEEQITPVSRRHLEAARAEARATTIEWLSNARNYVKYANEGGFYDEVKAFLDKHGR